MGVHNLSCYIRDHSERYSRELATVNGPINVVIDGSSLYFRVYHALVKRGLKKTLSAGNIVRFMKSFLDVLENNKIRIVAIVVDGMDDCEKIVTYQNRRKDKLKENNSFYEDNFGEKHHPSMVLWFRYQVFHIIRQRHNNNISIINCGVDADR